jgi:hypothetical protein
MYGTWNSEIALRPATANAASQANRSGWLRPGGGEKSRPTDSTVSGIAAIINGSRRPRRDLMLSDHDPIAGSTRASKASPTASAAPTRAPDRPSTTE